MKLNDVYRPIQSELRAAEAFLVKELSLRDGLLGEMTRYVSTMPGKRLRPALALLGARLISPRARRAVPLAVAVEMIHTATLLHDDVIDGASLRRGLSTLNAKWGDTLSVLSGDYLYSKAFCLLSDLGNQRVLGLLSNTARQVCEGEVAQIHHQRDLNLSRGRYLTIIEWKTASLMAAAAQAGSLLAGASESQAERLRSFGMNFGLAFQILDDTQDLIGTESACGKSLGTDLGQGQMTLPLIYLRDVAKGKTLKRLSNCFNGNGSHTPRAKQEAYRLLQEEAIRHEVPAYCKKVSTSYLARARKALLPFPESAAKTSLLALTDYLIAC